MWYDDIEPLGECPEMQNGTENLNETAVALIRKALNAVSLDANNGEYVWVIEVYNSTWLSTCTKLLLPHSREQSETFQCNLRAFNLCFTLWNYKRNETMQAT